MSKRNFGTIKSLLHFDYPYYNEPGDGLGDEVGLETWSKEANAALYGTQIPKAGTRAPKFGYRCLYARGAVIGTNTTGIWNLNSSGDYEIGMFVSLIKNGGTRYLFRLENEELLLMLDLTSAGELRLRISEWEVADVTGQTVLSVCRWYHVLLRVSEQKLTLYLDGAEELRADLPANVTLSPTSAKIGYFSSTTYAFYVDEFMFRHSAGSKAPKVPTEPYSGVLDLSKVGGYTGVGECIREATTIDTNTALNQTGLINTITDSRTFSVVEWVTSYDCITAGSEVMIHISSPFDDTPSGYSNYLKMPEVIAYPFVGMYAFAKVASIENTNVVLEEDILYHQHMSNHPCQILLMDVFL